MTPLKLLSPRPSFKAGKGLYKQVLTLIALLLASLASAQQMADSLYWVYFTDKEENGYEIENPHEFLSQRSIERRAWQNLGVDLRDEPVRKAYVDSLLAMGVEVRHVSRWLNGVAMVSMDEEQYQMVLEKSFTDTLPWLPESRAVWFPPAPAGDRFEPPLEDPPSYQYGVAREQVSQVRMDLLHQEGYTGKGVRVAVLDAGFRNVDTLSSFKSMISEGRLLGTRNFVNDSSVFRMVNSHGMYVLSIIGAKWDGYLMGTAPDASFFLCATENVHEETHLEEIAWIEAAEYVDSLGYDVINTSLGYSDMDSTAWDYTYEDMDGESILMSRAASLLASRGMILSNSAGNEGSKEWYRITAPSDAKDIICVGAVDSLGNIASFSSRGPSFDGRVKPELSAMGRATGIQYGNGNLARGSGTSFSAPVISGSVASLWQAYPEMPARELIRMIRNTGDRFDNPDATYGYGIPDFARAYGIISSARLYHSDYSLNIYPNPARDFVRIDLPGRDQGEFLLSIYDMNGRLHQSQLIMLPGELSLSEQMAPGLYMIRAQSRDRVYLNRLIVQ